MSLWHLASLDAPTVAVTWCMAFASASHVRLPLWIPCILALGTWAVYIGDRLLDAWRARTPLRERHHFHWRHRRVFVPVALMAFCAAMSLVVRYMPLAARGRNSLLAAAALAYFTGVHRPGAEPRVSLGFLRKLSSMQKFPIKELLVAMIFTLACAAPTWARISGSRVEMFALLGVVVCFGALAWLNCHAIEVWESEGPASSQPAPQALRQRISGGRMFHLAILLAAGIAGASAITAFTQEPRTSLILATAAVSAGLLAALDRWHVRMSPIRLRAAADLVLLTPLVLLALR